MRLSDYVVEKLVEVGIPEIFMVTGRGILFLTDAVAKCKKIKSVCTHHEQSAAYAAVAQAQLTGNIGACLVSTGCGSTNAITGVLTAYQDANAVIFISGQNVLKETTYHTGLNIRTFGQQEANIVEIVKPITKYAVTITDPQTIRFHLEKALHLATDGNRGPVWIDIPLDLQSTQVEATQLQGFYRESTPLPIASTDVNFIKLSLAASQRPVVLIGSGIRNARCISEFIKFVESNELPVVYTSSAPDILPRSHRLCIGSLGSMGCSRAAAFAVQNSDLLIVFGSRLSSITTGEDFCKFAREAKIIIVDIDFAEHEKKGVKIDRLIVANVSDIIQMLGFDRLSYHPDQWVATCQGWKKRFFYEDQFRSDETGIDIYDLCSVLSGSLTDNAVVITDSGLVEVIVPNTLDYGPNRRAIHPNQQGAMGFAIPAALGVLSALRQTVIVVGDGSFMMNMQELQTIKDKNCPIMIIVINNNLYSIIRRRQRELFRNRTIGTDPSNGISAPDFSKIAALFDFEYVKITELRSLKEILGEIISSDKTVICEIAGKQDQGYVQVSHARSLNGSFVRRPLEDQWPFLDRDTFMSEMIVKPIDQ
jgi:acetolactate synthase-1/2/3 large subunit